MKRFALRIIFLSLISNGLFGQSQLELCRQVEAAYAECDLSLTKEKAKQLKALATASGLQDTIPYVRAMLKYAIARNLYAEEPIYDELFAITPKGTPVYAELLLECGSKHTSKYRLGIADSLIHTGLSLLKDLGLENSFYFVRGMSFLSNLTDQKGETIQAGKLWEESRARFQQLNIPPNRQLARINNSIAGHYLVAGDLKKAAEAAEASIAIYRESCLPENSDLLASEFMLTTILLQANRVQEADKVIHEIMTASENAYTKESGNYARGLELKGDLLNQMGVYKEAIACYRETIALYERLKMSNYYLFNAWVKYAYCMISADEKAEARQAAETARKYKTDETMEAFLLDIEATCAETPAEAATIRKKAILILQQMTGRNDGGGYAQSLLDVAQDLLRANHPEEAQAVLADFADYANFAYEQNTTYINLLLTQGLFSGWTGDFAQALPKWQKVADLVAQKLVNEELFVLNENQRLEKMKSLRQVGDIFLSFSQRAEGKVQDLNALSLNLHIATQSVLLSTAAQIRQGVIDSDNRDLKDTYTSWTDLRQRLSWCYTQAKEDIALLEINLPALEASADSLEQSLARQSAAFAAARLQVKYNWEDVRAHLQPGQAAVAIVRYNQHLLVSLDSVRYAIFIIRPEMQEKPAVVFLPDGERLDQILLEKYLSECATLQGKGQTGDLYEAFWKKVEPYLKDISRLYVSADGAFLKINLGAIQLPNGQYLADRYEVRNVFSLRDIGLPEDQMKGENASKTAFLAGNPMFLLKNEKDVAAVELRSVSETPDSIAKNGPFESLLQNADETRGLNLSPLPGSEQEVNNIAALLRKKGWETTVATGLSAKEEAVKSLQSPTVLHLATHGYFLANVRSGTAGLSRSVLENNPMLRSMIFFAGAQNTLDKKPLGNEDGILTAYEAQNLHLEGTELVVLSACQTAQGKIQNGEGVYGLQRALRIAGAKAVLLSLWDVDDKVGREFMTAFYEKWLGGMGKSEAFRVAQLEIKKKHPQPFYWAGFVLIGG